MYQLKIQKSAFEELQVLPQTAVKQISSSIDALASDPRPQGCKKLKGSKAELWRIRAGS